MEEAEALAKDNLRLAAEIDAFEERYKNIDMDSLHQKIAL